MKRLLLLLLPVSILLAGCGKGSQSPSRPLLAVSIEPQQKMLEELAGDYYDIVTMMPSGANPETYEPTMKQRKALSNAKSYFTVGYLPFEETLARKLPKSAVINTSRRIVPVTGTHSHGHNHGDHHGHSHGDADPHTWTSFHNAKIMGANMLNELIAIDPIHSQEYIHRYAAMCQRIDSLDMAVANKLQQAGVHVFAVWHPSLSYFARDYGLRQLAMGQESKEMSIASLRDVIQQAKDDSVAVFFFQKEYDSRQAENVNNAIGARMVTINPLAYDWEDELVRIADELAK